MKRATAVERIKIGLAEVKVVTAGATLLPTADTAACCCCCSCCSGSRPR